MINLVYIWLALAFVLFAIVIGKGLRAGPLVMAYFLGLSLIHVPGAMSYAGAAAGAPEEDTVRTGFQIVLIGLGCLLAGTILAQLTARTRRAHPAAMNAPPDGRHATLLFLVGLGAYFFALPLAAIIPSATSIISSAGLLILVGFWAYFHHAERSGDSRRFALGLAALPLLPLSTMVTGGFAGFGVVWLVGIFSGIYVMGRRKLTYVVMLPVIAFVGLSFAVAYFSDRAVLREQVWQQTAGVEDRIGTVIGMVSKAEPIDFNNEEHVRPLLLRLNESVLLGAGVERRQNGQTALVYGATVPLWVLVPRILWPDKPQVGGGGDLVTQFTGIEFAEGTSVGAGQPLEFYMNFGLPGVIGGFLLWGFVLGRLDLAIRRGLLASDTRTLLRAGLPGLAMLQPGGNLIEILVAVVASYLVALGVEAALRQFGLLGRSGSPLGRASLPQPRLPRIP